MLQFEEGHREIVKKYLFFLLFNIILNLNRVFKIRFAFCFLFLYLFLTEIDKMQFETNKLNNHYFNWLFTFLLFFFIYLQNTINFICLFIN